MLELHKPRLDSFDVYHLGDPPGPRRARVWVGLGPHIIVEFEQGEPVAPGTRYPKVGLQIQGSRVVGRLMTRPTGEIETQMTRDVYSEE